MERYWNFGEGFPPRNIAIVGVSRSEATSAPGYTGLGILCILIQTGFPGRLYPVNPYASVIEGLQVYPKVTDIPERLDLVIVTVPPAAVPEVVRDCVDAKALNVQICTSGFSETGLEEGKKLEEEIKRIALEGNLRIIGPNCIGFQIPSARIQMHADTPLVPGPVAFVSQSGGHARIFLLRGPELGLGFSTAISYGNALLLDSTDFLEYLRNDPETQIICLYLEGIKDGRRFMKLVKQLNPVKPVVIWKGGLTTSGARAAVSHTASLAGEKKIWDAFFKQTGAIEVGSVDEMANVAMTLLRLKPSTGKRAAVLAAGGGSSVATGDICAQEGIELQPLSEQTKTKMLEFISLVNQGVANPIDVPNVVMDYPGLVRAYEVLSADPVIDMVIIHLGAEFFMGKILDAMVELQKHVLTSADQNHRFKPLVVALSNEGQEHDIVKYERQLNETGVPTYGSLRTACRALNRFANFYKFLDEIRSHANS